MTKMASSRPSATEVAIWTSSPSTASRSTSKGNLYTMETYEGKRVQKFTYKGTGPVTSMGSSERSGREDSHDPPSERKRLPRPARHWSSSPRFRHAPIRACSPSPPAQVSSRRYGSRSILVGPSRLLLIIGIMARMSASRSIRLTMCSSVPSAHHGEPPYEQRQQAAAAPPIAELLCAGSHPVARPDPDWNRRTRAGGPVRTRRLAIVGTWYLRRRQGQRVARRQWADRSPDSRVHA